MSSDQLIYIRSYDIRIYLRINKHGDRYAIGMVSSTNKIGNTIEIKDLTLDALYDIAHQIESYAQNEERYKEYNEKNKETDKNGTS